MQLFSLPFSLGDFPPLPQVAQDGILHDIPLNGGDTRYKFPDGERATWQNGADRR